MKGKKKLFNAVFSSVIILFFFSGCDTDGKQNVTVKMKNNSSDNVHMWINTETIDPSNKLSPGGSRNATASVLYDSDTFLSTDWTITVYAGRNGETLDYIEIPVTTDQGDYSVKVQFTKSESLDFGN